MGTGWNNLKRNKFLRKISFIFCVLLFSSLKSIEHTRSSNPICLGRIFFFLKIIYKRIKYVNFVLYLKLWRQTGQTQHTKIRKFWRSLGTRVTQTIVVTSQTIKYQWDTTFSHSLGQMNYRNALHHTCLRQSFST